jgi:hypothetical protein
LEAALEKNLQVGKSLEQELTEAQEKLVKISQKYAIYSEGLDSIAVHLNNPNLSITELDAIVTQYQTKIDNHSTKIADAISNGSYDESMMHELEALHMQLESALIHRGVMHGEHCYYDDEGSACALDKATYVIPAKERIHTHNNELVLVPVNKTPETMSIEEMHEGKQKVKEMQCVPVRIKNNFNNETTACSQHIDIITQKQQENNAERTTFSSALKTQSTSRDTLVNSCKPLMVKGLSSVGDVTSTALILNTLENSPPSPLNMQPTPKPNANDPVKEFQKEFQKELQAFKKTGKMPANTERLSQLIVALSPEQRVEANKFLQDPASKMRTHAKDPITAQHLPLIIQLIERIGLGVKPMIKSRMQHLSHFQQRPHLFQ